MINYESNDLNEIFFERFSSPDWIRDSLFLYLIIPLSFIAILLNLLTFIFLQTEIVQKSSLNTYIKIYTFVSLLICLTIFLSALTSIPRYLPFSYSYEARIFSCQIYAFTVTIMVLYSNILNILILVERLSVFVLRFCRFHSKNPLKLSTYVLIVCVLIKLIIFFQSETKNEQEFNEQKKNVTLLMNLNKCERTDFSQTNFSKAYLILTYFVENILCLIVEIGGCKISIKYFRKYVYHKQEFINMNEYRRWRFNNTNEIYQLSIINHNNQHNEAEINQRELIYELNVNLTRFILIQTIMSIFCNIISFLSSIIFVSFSSPNSLFLYFVLVFDLFYIIKHGSLFFVLILFNKYFRDYFFYD